MQPNPYELEFGSEQCHALLKILNQTTVQPDAAFGVDIMSGGYKFSDEFPRTGINADSELLHPLVTLLRILLAFRVSLVRGQPRMELAHWWDLAIAEAPRWAGFTKDRWSATAAPYAAECTVRCSQFCADLNKLERAFQKQLSQSEAASQELADSDPERTSRLHRGGPG